VAAAEAATRAAQDATAALQRADAERKGRGRWARLQAAWRGEEMPDDRRRRGPQPPGGKLLTESPHAGVGNHSFPLPWARCLLGPRPFPSTAVVVGRRTQASRMTAGRWFVSSLAAPSIRDGKAGDLRRCRTGRRLPGGAADQGAGMT